MFHDSLNVSGSATPNCFSRFLPKAVHNCRGMVDGFISGQILSWVTHIFVMSHCHAWDSMYLCNEGKDTIYRPWILPFWAYRLEYLQQSQKAACVHYLLDIFLTGELYVSLPRMNSHSSTRSASCTNKSWSLISFMISTGNLWTLQAALTIWSGLPT